MVGKVSQIQKHHIWFWYTQLQRRVTEDVPPEERISIFTQHGYIRAVRRFLKWLLEKEFIEIDFSTDIKLPRLPKGGKKGVRDKHVNTLLKAAQSNVRDYAILHFFESTGCRRGGVAGLRLTDLNLDAKPPLCYRVTVREKGEAERIVFMSSKALEALKTWLNKRKSESDFVFINLNFPDQGLSPHGVSEIIRRYKDKEGIRGKVSPHQWRHRHGRKLTEAGMPLGLVSQTLGHSTVVVTNDFYGIFAVGELQKAVENYYRPPEEDKE